MRQRRALDLENEIPDFFRLACNWPPRCFTLSDRTITDSDRGMIWKAFEPEGPELLANLSLCRVAVLVKSLEIPEYPSDTVSCNSQGLVPRLHLGSLQHPGSAFCHRSGNAPSAREHQTNSSPAVFGFTIPRSRAESRLVRGGFPAQPGARCDGGCGACPPLQGFPGRPRNPHLVFLQ